MENSNATQEVNLNVARANAQSQGLQSLISEFPIRKAAGLIFLVGWVMLSYFNGGLFWNEILITSTILCGLLLISPKDISASKA